MKNSSSIEIAKRTTTIVCLCGSTRFRLGDCLACKSQ